MNGQSFIHEQGAIDHAHELVDSATRSDSIYDKGIDKNGKFVFPMPSKRYLVGARSSYGYYANDPLHNHSLINAEIRYDKNMGSVVLKALRDIDIGEEIFVSYGSQYWSLYHRQCTGHDHETLMRIIYDAYGHEVMDAIFREYPDRLNDPTTEEGSSGSEGARRL